MTTIAMMLYNNMTALDFVGPYQIFSSLPDVEILTVAKQAGPIAEDGGLTLFNADYAFSQVTEADILFVPGSGDNRHVISDEESRTWVEAIDKTSEWTTSVCTGSLILGAAGCLEGRKATTHWSAMNFLNMFGAIPTNERVVTDGKYVTGAGVSAGIDMALTFAAVLRGDDIAQVVQLTLEYDPQPPFNAGSLATAPDHIAEMAVRRLTAT